MPLSGGSGLERVVGLVALRYVYLYSLAYSDLETSARKAYGKPARTSREAADELGSGSVVSAVVTVRERETRASCEMGSARRSDGRRSICYCDGDSDSYLVDPASSHMLVSKIKPCMSKHKLLHSEAANGSLGHP